MLIVSPQATHDSVLPLSALSAECDLPHLGHPNVICITCSNRHGLENSPGFAHNPAYRRAGSWCNAQSLSTGIPGSVSKADSVTRAG